MPNTLHIVLFRFFTLQLVQ